MDAIEQLGPELAVAFACITAVGSSRIRRFRIEDAKACTRICRSIRFWTAPIPSFELSDLVRALTSLDALTEATAMLACRLRPLDDVDTTLLNNAEAAMASLRQDLTSDEVAAFKYA